MEHKKIHEPEREQTTEDTDTEEPRQPFIMRAPQRREIQEEPHVVTEARHLLKVMTYNIWNNRSYWQERTCSVIKILRELQPDVACLLDVNESQYGMLKEALEKYYTVFQGFIEEGNKAGAVFFCNKATVDIVDQPYFYDYNFAYGCVIGVEVLIKSTGNKVHVVATELDKTPDNDHIRADQVNMIQQVLKPLKHFILVGDFNIYNYREDGEKKLSQCKLIDAWSKIGCPPKIKYTYDCKKNNCFRFSDKVDRTQLRNSRIYYNDTHQIEIKGLSLIGLEHINPEIPIPPSCFYGLMATFQSHKRKHD